MNSSKFEKINIMKDADLAKEINSLNIAILNQRIDIANRKTKGMHKISQFRKDIARINTVISSRKGESNGK